MTLSTILESPKTELPESTLAWLKLAIAEDLPDGDITSDTLFSEAQQVEALIESQQPMVVSGLLAAQAVFKLIDRLLKSPKVNNLLGPLLRVIFWQEL